jgi:hypothetical protein
LTNYESYPAPGSEECIKFSGCDYLGDFAFLGHLSEAEVRKTNIVAVHDKDAEKLGLAKKTLRIRQGNKQIDALVADVCADSDCDGCCSENKRGAGFLIDMEVNTVKRFGSGEGVVEWACLDCKD